MKNKQPKISNYFETSQILLLIKQPDQSFYQSLSNVHPKFQGKNEKFQKKIRKFQKKSENFGKNQKILEKIGKFQEKIRKKRKISEKIRKFQKKSEKTEKFIKKKSDIFRKFKVEYEKGQFSQGTTCPCDPYFSNFNQC